MFANKSIRTFSVGLISLLCIFSTAFANYGRFQDAKTLFQTNTGYDERIAIAVDGVIVHRHGTN
ncbi:MAG: hypothetical protein ACYS8Z_20025, partial [Planctomycetota bacterium]